jgi:hypothetical protein
LKCMPSPLSLTDQFAFRPTGSTTAALITILSHITELLSTHPYVIMISLDFSKAFDSVRHGCLLDKMASLIIPDQAYNWMVKYFENRSHCTRFGGTTSATLNITASVVQGSCVGPSSFIISSSDLHPVCIQNKMAKYADDMNLLVGSFNAGTISTEMGHITTWAETNNLRLNPDKCKEIVFRRQGRSNLQHDVPPPTPGLHRVSSIKILGVTLQSNLRFDEHISEVISSSASSLHAVRTLRSHGLPDDGVQEVCRATTMARLMYASPAWWGYTTQNDRDRFEAFVRKARRLHYIDKTSPTAAELSVAADNSLFKALCVNRDHVLHHMLPSSITHGYNLRSRPHNYILPTKDTKNFIPRMLYKNTY